MKTVYTIFNQPQANGAYFYAANYADDYPLSYPQTDVAIPEDMLNGLPKFDWGDGAWHDASEDAQAKLLSDLQKDNSNLKDALTTAEADNKMLKQAVASIGLKVAELSTPEPAPDAKPTEVTE